MTAPDLTPEELARKRGMSVLRGAQHRVAQRPATPSEERALPGAMEVPIDRVLPDPGQPRRDWGHDEGERRLEELTASIQEFGILQPLLVREGAIRPDGVQEFIIIAGGRRRAAAERAGLATVPVLVRGEEGVRVRVLQLIENVHRQDLSPLDEARAYQELIDIEGLTPPELAVRLNISDQKIRDRLRLLTNQAIADALERKQLNLTAARSLQQLPDGEIAAFKARLRLGERIEHAEIEACRQRLIAAGIVNPRYKGGGRGRALHRASGADQSAFDTVSPPGTSLASTDGRAGHDQTKIDPPSSTRTDAPKADNLEATGQPLSDSLSVGAAVIDTPNPALLTDQSSFDSMASPHPPVRVGDIEPARIADIGRSQRGGHPAATEATARELGARIWRHLPEELRATVRELAVTDPSLAWGVAVAEGMARHFDRGRNDTHGRAPV